MLYNLSLPVIRTSRRYSLKPLISITFICKEIRHSRCIMHKIISKRIQTYLMLLVNILLVYAVNCIFRFTLRNILIIMIDPALIYNLLNFLIAEHSGISTGSELTFGMSLSFLFSSIINFTNLLNLLSADAFSFTKIGLKYITLLVS